jgi:ATP-dependent Clp protease protease subunit
MYLTPIVIDQTSRGERSFDIFSRLLQDRIILIFGEINTALASSVIAQILFLESVDSKKDIQLYINSPGGAVSDGLAIYDVMKFVECDIVTIGMGMCASMGAFLLSSGTKGKRYVLENTKVMIHQPLGGTSGAASDIMIAAEEIIKTKKRLNDIIAFNTNQSIEKITIDTERDFYMDALAATNYGIVDKIINKNHRTT